MRLTSLSTDQNLIDFAKTAAKHFEQNPQRHSFGEVEASGHLALRWNDETGAVLVLAIADDVEPVVFNDAIRKDHEQSADADIATIAREFLDALAVVNAGPDRRGYAGRTPGKPWKHGAPELQRYRHLHEALAALCGYRP